MHAAWRRRPQSFPLRLRATATFRPVSPVVFVSLTEGISSCEILAEAIRQGPLAQDLAFPFHPHVTVAHDLADAALDLAFAEPRRLQLLPFDDGLLPPLRPHGW